MMYSSFRSEGGGSRGYSPLFPLGNARFLGNSACRWGGVGGGGGGGGGGGVTEDAVQLRVLTMRVGSGEPNVDLNGELWDVNSVNPGVA